MTAGKILTIVMAILAASNAATHAAGVMDTETAEADINMEIAKANSSVTEMVTDTRRIMSIVKTLTDNTLPTARKANLGKVSVIVANNSARWPCVTGI